MSMPSPNTSERSVAHTLKLRCAAPDCKKLIHSHREQRSHPSHGVVHNRCFARPARERRKQASTAADLLIAVATAAGSAAAVSSPETSSSYAAIKRTSRSAIARMTSNTLHDEAAPRYAEYGSFVLPCMRRSHALLADRLTEYAEKQTLSPSSQQEFRRFGGIQLLDLLERSSHDAEARQFCRDLEAAAVDAFASVGDTCVVRRRHSRDYGGNAGIVMLEEGEGEGDEEGNEEQ